jgi:asparaginyl-tRNA synthetase
MAFITFDDLLSHIESLFSFVLDRVLSDEKTASLIKQLHPTFAKPVFPFLRMTYQDAIAYLKKHEITKDDGSFYQFGEDIPQAPERAMIEKIGRPVFLTHFPHQIKAFYMQRDPQDRRVTESVDLLLPGVGEVLGGSMRMYSRVSCLSLSFLIIRDKLSAFFFLLFRRNYLKRINRMVLIQLCIIGT